MHRINSPLCSVLSLKLPPPPCAVLLVIYPHFLAVKRLNPSAINHIDITTVGCVPRNSQISGAPEAALLPRSRDLADRAIFSDEPTVTNQAMDPPKTDGSMEFIEAAKLMVYIMGFKKSQKMMILVASIVDYITYDWKSPS